MMRESLWAYCLPQSIICTDMASTEVASNETSNYITTASQKDPHSRVDVCACYNFDVLVFECVLKAGECHQCSSHPHAELEHPERLNADGTGEVQGTHWMRYLEWLLVSGEGTMARLFATMALWSLSLPSLKRGRLYHNLSTAGLTLRSITSGAVTADRLIHAHDSLSFTSC